MSEYAGRCWKHVFERIIFDMARREIVVVCVNTETISKHRSSQKEPFKNGFSNPDRYIVYADAAQNNENHFIRLIDAV